jgi:DNA-binding protein H-NS
MKLDKLSDKDLSKIASDIDLENKRRANRKAAASAILAVLKKHKLSVSDLSQLELGPKTKKAKSKNTSPNKGRKGKATAAAPKKADKRAKVAFKYKNPIGSEKWSGRGRAPKWVSAILAKKRISMTQFKADKRYKI